MVGCLGLKAREYSYIRKQTNPDKLATRAEHLPYEGSSLTRPDLRAEASMGQAGYVSNASILPD